MSMGDHSCTAESYTKEKELKAELEEWVLVEESIMRKKFRVQWLKLGDANTAYFFANTKSRIAQNQVRRLIAENGEVIQTEKGIIDEIIGFYKKLLGTNAEQLPAIHPKVMQGGPIVNREQQFELTAPITKEEVYQALKDIDDLMALGYDGFNACFFKKACPVIGEEVATTVLHFFESASMYKAINCTSDTLIPKVQNPSSVKEYRHISCCTILYKMISKVLTKRLQMVIDSLIDSGQATFVPGRLITDNILLSHELVKGYGRKGISPRCMMKIDMLKAYDSVEWAFFGASVSELKFPCFICGLDYVLCQDNILLYYY